MAAGLAASAVPPEPDAVEIMPENWDAMRLFVGMETQWRRAGMTGIATGLDYGALPVVAGALGLAVQEDLMGRLRLIENAALAALLERRA